MKRIIAALAATLMIVPATAPAGDNTATVLGALLGAGVGLAISHHHGGLTKDIAVPLGAIAGGMIARNWDNDPFSYNHHYYGHHSRYYYHPGYGYPRYGYHDRVVVVPQPAAAAAPAPPPAVSTPDPQPGVDLVKVSIRLANGTRVDIPVLRIGSRFVGPQGEEYASLPTAETLEKAYSKE